MANAFDAIATERLLIRPYREADIGAAQALLGDPETMAFWPRPFNPEEAADWVRRNIERIGGSIYGRCALVRRADDLIVGDVGVVRAQVAGEERNDLGYILARQHWGQGYAIEAALALRDHYFGVFGVETLIANMAWDHRASQRVAERIGMRRVLEFHNPRNRGILTYLYAIERAAAALR
jgi:RimJ/RimL family protein N-acetyltransferase